MKKLILLSAVLCCFISCDKDQFEQENQQKDIQQPLLKENYNIPSNIENNDETNALKRGEEDIVRDVLMEYVNVLAPSDAYEDFVTYHYNMMLADPKYVTPIEDFNLLISQFPKFETLFNEFQNLGLTHEEFLILANSIEHEGATAMKSSGEPEGDGCWICSASGCAFSLAFDAVFPAAGWLGQQVHCD